MILVVGGGLALCGCCAGLARALKTRGQLAEAARKKSEEEAARVADESRKAAQAEEERQRIAAEERLEQKEIRKEQRLAASPTGRAARNGRSSGEGADVGADGVAIDLPSPAPQTPARDERSRLDRLRSGGRTHAKVAVLVTDPGDGGEPEVRLLSHRKIR